LIDSHGQCIYLTTHDPPVQNYTSLPTYTLTSVHTQSHTTDVYRFTSVQVATGKNVVPQEKAKNQAAKGCLGKPLPPAKYPTFTAQRSEILLTLRVEQVTFILARTPRSFIAKMVVLPIGPH
jgi:hypothetical protein